ncbi:MAG: aminopeptidase P family N-terminal domain-containing protein, partial [Rhodospirillales bacterium]|nr:aminopeptidase P family N-terminal domain-containing protein [Rhodospirillales bacterium]
MSENLLCAPPPPDVPRSELSARLTEIRMCMGQSGVDAVILTDRSNIEYVSDYRTLTWAYNS